MLADPEQLSSISYEELKTIVLAYPYAHNLRYLLALKAQQENRPDAIRTLATAAAYSLDRTQLFLLYAPKMVVPVQEAVMSEVLELKPLEIVQRELEALTPQKRPESVPMAAVASPSAVPTVPVSVPTPAPKPASSNPAGHQSFHSWLSRFQPPVLQPAVRSELRVAVPASGFVVPVSAPEPTPPPPPAAANRRSSR